MKGSSLEHMTKNRSQFVKKTMEIWSWKNKAAESQTNRIWQGLGLHLGGFMGVLGASWALVGASWPLFGRLLGALVRVLGASWVSWAPLG